MKLKFLYSNDVTSDVKSFIFEPEQPITWEPGQYMHYLIPHDNEDNRGHERWFTNSAAPFENHIMISTRINKEKGSSLKCALQNLEPGDEVEADGPEGDFIVEEPNRNYIFVAGGIGITPFRSILQQAVNQGQKLHVNLLYANRTDEIPFKEELDGLASKNPHLKIEYVTQPKQIDGKLIKRRIDELENPLVYISGPEPMVKSFAQELKNLGVDERTIKLDDFPGYETY